MTIAAPKRRWGVHPSIFDYHRRFRDLAATSIDYDLSPVEDADLWTHLLACHACRRFAAGLDADAARLRILEETRRPRRSRGPCQEPAGS